MRIYDPATNTFGSYWSDGTDRVSRRVPGQETHRPAVALNGSVESAAQSEAGRHSWTSDV
jgi:hypothetical protein